MHDTALAPTPGATSTSVRPTASDPVARGLVIALLGVLALFLVAVVAAILFGFMRPATSPRTLAERDLVTYGNEVAGGKADPETMATYVAVLIDAGQYSKAKQALTQALSRAKSDRSYLLVQQSRLQYARGDFEASAKSAESALSAASAEFQARLDALKAKGITPKSELERPRSYLDALHLKADSLAKLGRWSAAIEAYDAYLGISPTDADMLVIRGDAKAKTGDTAGAEADYRKALTFIPDYQAARDGLEQIGAESK